MQLIYCMILTDRQVNIIAKPWSLSIWVHQTPVCDMDITMLLIVHLKSRRNSCVENNLLTASCIIKC